MMVANSFDLWQKDAFFSAAEEVQESADVMESAYRMWMKEKREGSKPEDFDELSRDLQTALGTAKWQLEEFERAVRSSHGHSSDDVTASRHKQFVAAIGSQISHAEAALRDAFSEGKQPLRWVNLDKKERDDLAMFLSGNSQTPLIVKDDCNVPRSSKKICLRESHQKRKDMVSDLNATTSTDASDGEGPIDVVTSSKNGELVIDVEEKELAGIRDDIICQADKTVGTRRTWSSANFGALKIVVANEDGQSNKLMSRVDATPKEKGSKPLFWNQRCGEHPRALGSINFFKQVFAQVGGLQRQLQTPPHLQFSCSIQVILALMLSIFLIVPFLLYST